MNTPLENLNNISINKEILALSSRNHERRKYIRNTFLTKPLLKYLVETCNYSHYHIATEIFKPIGYLVDAGTLIDFCRKNNIKTKSIKERANDLNVREKYKKTCLQKYKKNNALSKNTTPYKKRNKTIKSKYGVDNVFQLDTIKKKSKETLLNKYGVNNPINIVSYKRNSGRRSKIQKKVEYLLKKNKINFKSEVGNIFGKFNKKLNKFYSPIVDIFIENMKIVIEINGDHWHGNPSKYKSDDIIKKWGGLIKVSDIWELDKIRQKQIESFGYKVIVFWESDIRKNIEKIDKTIKNLKPFNIKNV
jgi:very-short-patch-repair endonuclease